ncbi:MAG: hypothetical protein LBQ58_05140 [Synergistaceae bacterium]|jgi:predicted DNA-binding protein|nr:hypothetical protein [Synergistaceae bacterium]
MGAEEKIKKSLTVKLDVDLLNEFNAAVKRQGKTNQFVVEEIIRKYLGDIEKITACETSV